MRGALIAFLFLASVASADAPMGTGEIDGVVTDTVTGAPVFGATVTVVSTGTHESTVTDEAGRYTVVRLAPGEYAVHIVYGETQVKHDKVAVTAGAPTSLRDFLDASATVITVKEKAPPPPAQSAEPTWHAKRHFLPYPDEAFVEDIWGLVWLLLDIDPTGKVVAAKFYKRAGHGFDEIAIREVFQMQFKPARDGFGNPVESTILYKMEWESPSLKAGLLEGTRDVVTSMPCAGSGKPLNLSKMKPVVYRDCSPPDYALGAREKWIGAPGRAANAPAPQVVDVDAAGGCKEGDAGSCHNLAMLLQKDDPKRAQALEEKSCADGVAEACTGAGLHDQARGHTFFERGCRLGDDFACRLSKLKDPADIERALAEAMCEERDPIGCYNTAVRIQDKDPRHAADLYQRACDVGVALACTNLGLLVQEGRGALKDPQRASALFQRACDADEPIGCTNLGHLYMNGLDLRKDPSRARAALEKACGKNEAVGCYNLAILVEWGIGGRYDDVRANALRERACKGGVQKACSASSGQRR